jgi:hypothetical protein
MTLIVSPKTGKKAIGGVFRVKLGLEKIGARGDVK